MLIGCFLIDIARLIEQWVKIITEIGVFIRGEKIQLVNFEMWLFKVEKERERERERERKKGGCTWKCKLYGYEIVILYGYLSE
jgi:hypothetical protein